jgi:hypothetical protein
MIFAHSGHLGDCLYSLPTVQILTGNEPAILYIKQVFEDSNSERYGNSDYNQYTAIKGLLEQQPYIKEVRPFTPADGEWWPGRWSGMTEKFIDLDDARRQDRYTRRYRFHLERYFMQFGIHKDWREVIPWLTVEGESKVTGNYAVFHVTDRWNSYSTDWGKVLLEARSLYDDIYFTGYELHWKEFCSRFGSLEYLPTENLLELAKVIKGSEALYTNQNCALVVAQGISKKYYLARNADRTHCHTGLNNENIL